MNRNIFELDGFRLAPVVDFSIFTGATVFAGDEDIDDFIINDAKRHFIHRIAVTYILTIPPDNFIYAFATLSNDAIKFKTKRFDGFPYSSLPAVKIGRLGVKKEFQHNGLGGVVLNMVSNFMCTSNRTGCRFITLDAYNKQNILHFYQKHGFDYIDPDLDCSKRPTVPLYKDLSIESLFS